MQPIDRGDYYEDPLTDTLQAKGLGEVTGGGTQLSEEPCGIEFCDLEISVHAADDGRAHALDEDVAERDEPAHDLAPGVGCHIDGEAAHAEVQLREAGVVVGAATPPQKVQSALRLDLDHLSAERREQRGGLGDDGADAQVEHPHAG